MKASVYKISLDILKSQSQYSLPMKKGDTAREIHITLREGGTPYEIGEECFAIFSGRKPDGNPLENNCVIQENTIIYKITPQTTSASGLVACETKLYGENGLIASPRFSIIVDEKNVGDEEVLKSEKEISALTELYSILAESENSRKNAETNRVTAEKKREDDTAVAIKNANDIADTLQTKLDKGEFKGEKGDKGDAFVYEDFTEEQLSNLKGDKGDAFTYADFTEEQLAFLKGDKGVDGTSIWVSHTLPTDRNFNKKDISGGNGTPVKSGDLIVCSPYMYGISKVNEDTVTTNWRTPIKGESVTIDTKMDDESTNPVENKVVKEYVDKCSKDTMYTFSVEELKDITIFNQPILTFEADKGTITNKDGVSYNIPKIDWTVCLYTAYQTADETQEFFNIPFKYIFQPQGLRKASITNLYEFEPYLIVPPYFESALPVKTMLGELASSATNYSYRLLSNSLSNEDGKILGCCLRVAFEFANETIRDSFYSEFLSLMKYTSHFVLRYKGTKTEECQYIGG